MTKDSTKAPESNTAAARKKTPTIRGKYPEGYGALRGQFIVRPGLDLTKPIYEQVLELDRHAVTVSPTAVSFDEHRMWVDLSDGRTIGVPLAWFPRLLNATEQERRQVELSRLGLHWEHLDEDISAAGLLAGRGDLTRTLPMGQLSS